MKNTHQVWVFFMVQRVGFEPTKAMPIDLQSIVFDHFTTSA